MFYEKKVVTIERQTMNAMLLDAASPPSILVDALGELCLGSTKLVSLYFVLSEQYL